MPPKVTEGSGQTVIKLMLYLVLMLNCVTVCWSQESHNPHNREGACEVCHVASESDLNSWFTFNSTKKKLNRDYNDVCIQCHSVSLGHGLGKRAEHDHKKLPFDADGKITCAITCHDMHISSGEGEQLRYHLRWPVNTLCESCHLND